MRGRPGCVALAGLAIATVTAAGGARAGHEDAYTVRVWSTDAGLPQPTVRAIAQTPDGYLWLGTEGGLARFDGVAFTLTTGPDARSPMRPRDVRSLLTDPED